MYFLFLFSLLCFCRPSKQSGETSITIKEIARASLGSEFTEKELDGLTLFSSIPRYIGDNHIKFMVVETESKKIIFGPENLNGKVSWNKKKELLIQRTPEVIKDRNSNTRFWFVLNVETGEEQRFENLKEENNEKI